MENKETNRKKEDSPPPLPSKFARRQEELLPTHVPNVNKDEAQIRKSRCLGSSSTSRTVDIDHSEITAAASPTNQTSYAAILLPNRQSSLIKHAGTTSSGSSPTIAPPASTPTNPTPSAAVSTPNQTISSRRLQGTTSSGSSPTMASTTPTPTSPTASAVAQICKSSGPGLSTSSMTAQIVPSQITAAASPTNRTSYAAILVPNQPSLPIKHAGTTSSGSSPTISRPTSPPTNPTASGMASAPNLPVPPIKLVGTTSIGSSRAMVPTTSPPTNKESNRESEDFPNLQSCLLGPKCPNSSKYAHRRDELRPTRVPDKNNNEAQISESHSPVSSSKSTTAQTVHSEITNPTPSAPVSTPTQTISSGKLQGTTSSGSSPTMASTTPTPTNPTASAVAQICKSSGPGLSTSSTTAHIVPSQITAAASPTNRTSYAAILVPNQPSLPIKHAGTTSSGSSPTISRPTSIPTNPTASGMVSAPNQPVPPIKLDGTTSIGSSRTLVPTTSRPTSKESNRESEDFPNLQSCLLGPKRPNSNKYAHRWDELCPTRVPDKNNNEITIVASPTNQTADAVTLAPNQPSSLITHAGTTGSGSSPTMAPATSTPTNSTASAVAPQRFLSREERGALINHILYSPPSKERLPGCTKYCP